MTRFLILQARPEADAADDEHLAILEKAGLREDQVQRIRVDLGPIPDLNLDDFAGVIVGGGPGCVSDDPATRDPLEARIEADILALMPQITARDMPYMGCCYGLGILAHHLGADVSKRQYGEPIGGVDCTVTADGATDPLLAGLPWAFRALVGHKEAVQELPEGAVHLVQSASCPFQMIRAGQNVYATQFHPEADGAVMAERIEIYKGHGYFEPCDAGVLKAAVLAEDITVPGALLARFVARYGA